MTFESIKTRKSFNRPTHSAPVESVSNGIFGLVRAGNHPCVDMLDIGSPTTCVRPSAAVINMDGSVHRRANEITHHRCSLIISGEPVTSQLDTRFIRSVNSPSSLGHRPVASFMLLPSVALKRSTKGVSGCRYS